MSKLTREQYQLLKLKIVWTQKRLIYIVKMEKLFQSRFYIIKLSIIIYNKVIETSGAKVRKFWKIETPKDRFGNASSVIKDYFSWHSDQSWALSVFFNLFNNKKLFLKLLSI